jgi:hypothetical protein
MPELDGEEEGFNVLAAALTLQKGASKGGNPEGRNQFRNCRESFVCTPQRQDLILL